MEAFEFLDHTSDLKFRAYGRSLEKCLANAAKALASAFVGEQRIAPRTEKRISVSAESLEVLVHHFLAELIYFFATEQYVAVDVASLSVRREGGYVLKAAVLGEVLDFSKQHVETEVKAVTYHDMKVAEEGGWWVIQVVCDI